VTKFANRLPTSPGRIDGNSIGGTFLNSAAETASFWNAIFSFLVIGLVLPAACHAAEPALPVFTDVTDQAGLSAKHSFGDDQLSNIVEGTGAGAAFFDYDGDGWMDVYLPNGAWLPDD
jgi:hypothetical protein